MAIKIIPHSISKELEQELVVYEGEDFHRKVELENVSSIEELHQFLDTINHFSDLKTVFTPTTKNIKLLDIGCGVGFTSLFLATQGYQVTSVEPSLACCKVLDSVATKLGLSINVVNATAEVIKALDEKFDIAVYHSSLHHCDDPQLALEKTRECLDAEGKIFLLDEPLLKIYRTKAWFYRTLIEDPVKLGHYGGNEHIYRIQEYKCFLRNAGFGRIKIIPSTTYQKTPQKMVWDNPVRFFVKRCYYTMLQRILFHKNIVSKMVSKLLMELSVVNVIFSADK